MIFPPVLAFLGDCVSPKDFTPFMVFRGWRVGPNSIFGKGQLVVIRQLMNKR
jgi:hypothetical protein